MAPIDDAIAAIKSQESGEQESDKKKSLIGSA
jgi:hypothetical protein